MVRNLEEYQLGRKIYTIRDTKINKKLSLVFLIANAITQYFRLNDFFDISHAVKTIEDTDKGHLCCHIQVSVFSAFLVLI